MRNFTLFKTARSFLFFFCLLAAGSLQAKVIYVNGSNFSGTQDGTSWAKAYVTLQHAIDLSVSGDQVWVEKGTYKQFASGDFFSMKNGVAIYGGFAGTETSLNQRDWKMNVTTLQGNNTSVIHIVNANSQTILDGFTITGGKAPGDGGGIYSIGSSPQIRNVTISDNSAVATGGGVYNESSSPAYTNVTIIRNTAGKPGGGVYDFKSTITITNSLIGGNNTTDDGGGMENYQSNVTVTNSVFSGNTCDKSGAGVFNSVSSTTFFSNVVFVANDAFHGTGGAAYNDASDFTFTNCSFVANSGNGLNGTGGIYSNDFGYLNITNCIFFNNTLSPSIHDIDESTNSGLDISYTFTKNGYTTNEHTVIQTANIQSSVSPFIDNTNPLGADGIWMTADDGLQLSLCASSVIDHGNNSARNLPLTDILGNARRFDVPFVADGGSGSAPIVDMGAYENQTTTTLSQITGSIGNAHTVPNPQESAADYITSITAPISGATLTWQKDELDGSGWVQATPTENDAVQYLLPNLLTTTKYQRTATLCNIAYPSNAVQIKVVDPNGAISGRIISKGGTPVKGIAIEVKRLDSVSGGPANFIYRDITKDDGTYSVTPVYFGDPSLSSSKATFVITPSKPKHGFNYASLTKTLSKNIPQVFNVDFTDTTVLSLSGTTWQQYLISSNTNLNKKCALDSVSIYNNGSYYTQSGYINGQHGQYAISITDPGVYKIKPGFKSHVFLPAESAVNVQDDTRDVDFVDTTTHAIIVKLTDGCGGNLGTVDVLFSDTLPNNPDKSQQTSCFTTAVTTKADTTLSVRLPARVYRASVVRGSFHPQPDVKDITDDDIYTFFSNAKLRDSLVRDITTHDTILTLVYERRPFLVIDSGLNIANKCNTDPNQWFALMHTGTPDTFKVAVYQGDPTLYHYCPLHDTSAKIFVSYNKIDAKKDTGSIKVITDSTRDVAVATVSLLPNYPEFTAPNTRTLTISFTDRYGRDLSNKPFQKKVFTTGVFTPPSDFVTKSPELPLMVLHDPPGDASYSTWATGTTYENATTFTAATGSSINPWVEVKVGVDLFTGIGVETENSVWGSINGSVDISSTTTKEDETILSATTTQEISTSESPDVIGDDGDIFVGSAINFRYAVATELSFKNCAPLKTQTIGMSPEGFATQFIYTTAQIRDVQIPALQLAQRLDTSAAKRHDDSVQISIWQTLLDNNAKNKEHAKKIKNISFDGFDGPITNSLTSDTTGSNTIQFSMDIDASVAIALGFESGGSGVSGGVNLGFQMNTGNTKSTTVTKETTTSYTLDDDDDSRDHFTVDVLEDPVYHSPMFRTVAASTSCPHEPGTVARDTSRISFEGETSQKDIDPSQAGIFVLDLHNYSETGETRTYDFSLLSESNSDGALVSINGIAASSQPVRFSIDTGAVQRVTVAIRKDPSSGVYAYNNLVFQLTDDCGGSTSSTATINSVSFRSPCSNITLAAPDDGWKLNAAADNILPVILTGYTAANLKEITLQYEAAGTSAWKTGFSELPSELGNTVSGDATNWDVSSLRDDGAYNLRVQVRCDGGNGTSAYTYSQVSSGTIDRQAPVLFGTPEPRDDIYTAGDEISFKYNENISVDSLQNKISIVRLSTKEAIPFTVSGRDNQIIVVPMMPLTNFKGDSIRVVAKGIKDLFGNIKAAPDTSEFKVDTAGVYLTAKSLDLVISNSPVFYNSNDSIKVTFSLQQPAAQDIVVNYLISGTAVLDSDYTAILPDSSNLYNYDGQNGQIVILKGKNEAVLKIDPTEKKDSALQKTVTISLASGGDYDLGTTTSVTGTINYSNVLPVTLVDFMAKMVNNKVNLQWQTSNETNTSYFIIERSTDGVHFTQIAKLNANGSGSNLYAIADANPINGSNYYRLKMVDKGGRYLYSNTVLINYTVSGLHIVNVNPSPVTGNMATVNIASDKTANLKLIVVDAVGRQMGITPVSVQPGINHVPVTFTNLTSGMYFVYAVDNYQRKSNVVQFVKQ